MRQNMTEAQICARLRELSSRSFHHTRKTVVKHEVTEYESTMVVSGGRKLSGSYKTSSQVIDAYEQEDWGVLESRGRMFEAGKGSRYTKRVHVNKGAHYTKSGGVTTTNRPTAHGEVGSVGRVITVKRFAGSRLTCVCKSKKF